MIPVCLKSGGLGHAPGSSARAVTLAMPMLLAPAMALAEETPVTDQTVWSHWDLTPIIVVPTLLILAVYAVPASPAGREASRPSRSGTRPSSGAWSSRVMSLVYARRRPGRPTVLDAPDPAHADPGDRADAHRPVSAAEHPDRRGLPQWLKRWALTPVVGSGAIQAVFAGLTQPLVVTVLFIVSLYAWQWPPVHNLAIVNEDVHDCMHFTMLAAGLLFFWRVFDHRPAPKGTRYGVRLMMLWAAVLSNIPIGAYTAFKTRELYTAYDIEGRLFHWSPMADERLGGFIMWAPASMMMLLAILLVVNAWGPRRIARTSAA